ncbi:ABC transporter ATP-binding protein [Paenibacillus physcomitrellae]|uniref:ABC transporter ATP-binding protein n=1 Tax=Paenibacillus physcomitrellae TaxID=1619311 RepID=A0ABQ1G676_9BACL|nr:ABC transporter ATP-binding protein [Paenibacillus physcomitrellae]GGA37556.1 ABC transporter ATP-binding protein [Paenibacillus physcomitrellae]
MIRMEHVTKSFDGRTVLRNVNVCIEPGQFWGLLGPNGSGKSTLLQLISGTEKPDSGKIWLEDKLVGSYSRKELSRKMAMLQQEGMPTVSFPVRDVIEMGRFPYQDWLGRDRSEHAEALVDQIMSRLDLLELADRPVSELSGGQRQRAALGKVMAQQPDLVLLDEPTTFLDIHYQIQFMELISEWRKDSGLTILAALHDINLAALYCDHLLVMKEGRLTAAGPTGEVLTPSLLKDVFEVDLAAVVHPDHDLPQFLLRPGAGAETPKGSGHEEP